MVILRRFRACLWLGLCLAWGGFGTSATAGLVFERTDVELRSAPSAEAVEVEFPFHNDGERPVRITRVLTSCGCTTARPVRESYAPRETGTLTARFEFGDRRGLQRKRIAVRTDDPAQPEIQLSITVRIEETVELDRSVLLWQRGEAASPRTVRLTSLVVDPVRVQGVEVVGGGFRAESREVEPGREHEVEIAPLTTAEAVSAQVVVRVQRCGAEPEKVVVRVRVKG